MTVASGLGWPPQDAAALHDRVPAAQVPAVLHRLSQWPDVWWFSSVTDGSGGRFDLPPPDGTCYLADTLDGALLEKLLRTPKRIVVAEHLDRLFHATISARRPPPTADLTAGRLRGLGLNAEIHTTVDYAKPRAWAAALQRAGWKAVRYALRGDPALRQRGIALFGRAGVHGRAPAGFRTSVARLDRAAATQTLEARGVAVHPVPRAEDLPIVTPP